MEDLARELLVVVAKIALLYILIYFTILVHECGHAVAALWCNVKIERMSIGCGPTLFASGKNPEESRFTIKIFPIVGYIRVSEEEVEKVGLFGQLFILAGGVIAQVYILALLSGDSVQGFFEAFVNVFRLAISLILACFETISNNIWDLSPLTTWEGDEIISDSPVAKWFVVVNISIIAFNLLPIPPLDGGRMCISVLSTFLPRQVTKGIAYAAEIIGIIYISILILRSWISSFT